MPDNDVAWFPSATDLRNGATYENQHPTTAAGLDISNADDVISYLMANAGKDEASRDMLFNYLLSEKSTSSARQWEEEQNAKRYQVMVDDLKKAGINPYWLNSLGGAANFQGTSNKYSGSAFETARRDYETERNNRITNTKTIMAAIVSAVVMAIALL